MLLLYFLASLALGASVLAENCDKSGILIYEDMGCTLASKGPNGCPNKYNCVGIGKQDKCYYKGKGYKGREVVSGELSSPSCDIGCFCTELEGARKFTCAALDCAEWLGAPIKPNCYRKYSLNECCSTGQACPPFENEDVKCVVDGKEYRNGERFYPKNSCTRCICQKGFNGKFVEPFCKRRDCGAQLKKTQDVQNACAPVYKRDPDEDDILCCPKTWTCPDGKEVIKGNASSEETCNFGKHQTLKIGQSFEKEIENVYGGGIVKVNCRCAVPPLLTCVEV